MAPRQVKEEVQNVGVQVQFSLVPCHDLIALGQIEQ